MKKRKFFITILSLFIVNCFAETKLMTFVDGAYSVYSKEDGLFFSSNIEDSVKFEQSKIPIDNYGWKKILCDNLPFGNYDKEIRKYVGYDSPYVIDGSNYAIIMSSESEGFRESFFVSRYWETLESIRVYETEELLEFQSPDYKRKEWGNVLATHGIKKITSSSFYTEQLKSSKIEYIPQIVSTLFSVGMHQEWINHNPWVPGKEKSSSGIGEYLDIEFAEQKNNLVILNGYVNPFKHYLYKANNRVKKATITSLDKDNPFTVEYEFEDYVHFSEINFPCAVNKVRFTIDEVYKGEKWDDTCIQAVITRWE